MKYSEAVKIGNIETNFFISDLFIEAAGWTTIQESDILKVYDTEGVLMLPPVSTIGQAVYSAEYFYGFPEVLGHRFLDYQFIYSPCNFLNISDRAFKLHRRKIKAFQNVFGDLSLQEWDGDGFQFLESWLNSRLGDSWEDPEICVSTFLEYPESNKKLVVTDSKIVGILNWDENYKYINFRNLLTAEAEGLQDYARNLFYQMCFSYSNKLVNDGGSLGKKGLYFFKERLRPIEIKSIYSNYKE